MRTFDAAPYLEKIKATLWQLATVELEVGEFNLPIPLFDLKWWKSIHLPDSFDFLTFFWLAHFLSFKIRQAEIDLFQPHVVASASKGGDWLIFAEPFFEQWKREQKGPWVG